jgi:HEAT repeat protein
MSPLFGPPNIAQMKERGDLKGLIKAVNHERSEIQIAAIDALGEIGGEQAVSALLRVLNGNGVKAYSHFGLKVAAAHSLGQVDNNPVIIDALITALQDDNENVRKASALALGNIGDTDGVEPLITLLADEHYAARESAAIALGMIGDPRALKPLIASLETDIKIQVITKSKVDAILLLSNKNNDGKAVEPVLDLLKRGDIGGKIKISIIDSLLNYVGPDSRIPPLIIEMFADKLYSNVAGKILVEQFGKNAIPFLEVASNNPNERVCELAAQCLKQILEANSDTITKYCKAKKTHVIIKRLSSEDGLNLGSAEIRKEAANLSRRKPVILVCEHTYDTNVMAETFYCAEKCCYSTGAQMGMVMAINKGAAVPLKEDDTIPIMIIQIAGFNDFTSPSDGLS